MTGGVRLELPLRTARLLAPALAALLLTGCSLGAGVYSNYRPIEELQLVQTLGIDAAGDGELLLSAAGKPADGGVSETVFRRAAGIPQGIEALQERTPRGTLFFAHTRCIVLGQECAARGLGGILDYVERDVHTRMGTGLFVVRGGSAQGLLCGTGDGWDIADVLASVRAETDRRGDSHVFDVRETAVALEEYGAALICALRAVDAEESVSGASGGLIAVADGYGILRDGQLVGFLDGDAALAASLLLGKAGTCAWQAPDGNGGILSAELIGGSPDYAVEQAEDGRLLLSLHVAPTAVIAALDAHQPRAVEGAAAEEALCAALDQALEEAILGVFARERAENADFLALGRALRLHGIDPAAPPQDWLQTLDVRVSADVRLRHSYDMSAPAGTDGGGAT